MRAIRLLCIFFASLFITRVTVAQRVVINQNPGLSSNVVVGQQYFHISESLYSDQEIGTGNFLSSTESIDKIAFYLNNSGLAPNIGQFRILMKEVPATLRTLGNASYTRTGYKLVFDGTVDMSGTGAVEIPLDSPFTRSGGKNMMVMIERLDSVQHFGFVFETSNGLEGNANTISSRRYNDSMRPVLSSTLLTTTIYRPAISFIHVFPSDVAILKILHPDPSCYDTLQTLKVAIQNQGMNTINAGEVQVTLKLRGSNVSDFFTQNSLTLQPGDSELIEFPSIPLSSTGVTTDTSFISMTGDGTTYNDTATGYVTTASTITGFPIQENMENTLDIFPYYKNVVGNRQLWRLQTNRYSNADMTPDSLRPQGPGIRFMLFDSWTAPASNEFTTRMFSNCIQMPAPTVNGLPVTTVTFSMSHDTLYPSLQDSLYLSVSNDNGLTWNRIQGFARWQATAVTPRWTQHTVDITAYDGQTVELGFEGVSKYGNAFGLDNITIKFTNPVPLTLIDFKAIKLEKTNRLIWSTAKEWNMDAFEIERSVDGIVFEQTGRVKSSGDGNYRSYDFEDINPVAGVQYYRLKMLENNQTFSYSPVQKIDRTVYYEYCIVNPVANHQLQMKLTLAEAESMRMVISDMQGKQLIVRDINAPAKKQIEINLPLSFPSGSYMINMRGKNSVIQKQIVLP